MGSYSTSVCINLTFTIQEFMLVGINKNIKWWNTYGKVGPWMIKAQNLRSLLDIEIALLFLKVLLYSSAPNIILVNSSKYSFSTGSWWMGSPSGCSQTRSCRGSRSPNPSQWACMRRCGTPTTGPRRAGGSRPTGPTAPSSPPSAPSTSTPARRSRGRGRRPRTGGTRPRWAGSAPTSGASSSGSEPSTWCTTTAGTRPGSCNSPESAWGDWFSFRVHVNDQICCVLIIWWEWLLNINKSDVPNQFKQFWVLLQCTSKQRRS